LLELGVAHQIHTGKNDEDCENNPHVVASIRHMTDEAYTMKMSFGATAGPQRLGSAPFHRRRCLNAEEVA